jgi:hypothetical protein
MDYRVTIRKEDGRRILEVVERPRSDCDLILAIARASERVMREANGGDDRLEEVSTPPRRSAPPPRRKPRRSQRRPVPYHGVPCVSADDFPPDVRRALEGIPDTTLDEEWGL